MSNCKLCSREPAISIHTGLISCSNPDCYMDEVDLPQEEWDSLMRVNMSVPEALPEALEILKSHNEWRRGEGEMANPTTLGLAIDLIIEHHESKTSEFD